MSWATALASTLKTALMLSEHPRRGSQASGALGLGARPVSGRVQHRYLVHADCGEPGTESRVQQPLEVLETFAALGCGRGRYRELHCGPATVSGSGGPGPGAGKGDLGCRRPAADAAADRVPAPVCRRHGSSGNCRSHRDEGRDGKDTPLSGAPIGTRQAGGNEMSKHLTEQGFSMYLIGDVSMEERTHADECAACQAKIANLTTSIAHFRGAVRNWSDRARAKDRAAELRWTVIPASDHLERLLLPALDLPWYRSLWSGIHDLFQPAPPLLDITSKPVLVRNIWGQYGRQKKSWVMSVALQSAVDR